MCSYLPPLAHPVVVPWHAPVSLSSPACECVCVCVCVHVWVVRMWGEGRGGCNTRALSPPHNVSQDWSAARSPAHRPHSAIVCGTTVALTSTVSAKPAPLHGPKCSTSRPALPCGGGGACLVFLHTERFIATSHIHTVDTCPGTFYKLGYIGILLLGCGQGL